jgi:hypothetical protein
MRSPSLYAAILATVALGACGDDDPTPTPDTGADTTDAGDTVDDTTEDTVEDTTDTEDEAPLDTGDADGSGEDDADTDTDTSPPEPLTFDYNWPIFERPTDPLADSDLTSCATYQEVDCTGEIGLRCDVYDVDAEEWVSYDAEEDDADMTYRAYLYDRWYDLYMSPVGQTAERVFKEEMPAGTSEFVWASPSNFERWAGAGDSAIWTGTALNAYILRYLATGTQADYERMVEKTEVMVNFFEVTGIPGYLARYHYLHVEPGTPGTPDYVTETNRLEDPDHRDIINPEQYDFLPAAYFEEGAGTPRWSGDPSIDQYGGPMMTFPAVYGLLGEEHTELKEKIVEHMTCYLHSLRRIELINLQDNESALEAFTGLFGGGELNLDPGSIDFTTLDTIVMYVHPQINVNNEDEYPTECGDGVQMEPWRTIDAGLPQGQFVSQVLTLVQDIDRENNGANHINHFYIPSIRGGDAMHMMHLALMAYAFTGDESYADFLRDELLTNIRTAEVAQTMSALIMPKYCRRFYGTNITASPLWAFNNLLSDSELDVWMQEVYRDEMWEKETADIGNVNTNLMYAGCVTEEIGGEGRTEALEYALEELARFGGNGGVLADPRRTYYKSYQDVVDRLPEGIEPECATEEERAICERPIAVFGAQIDGETISFECTGHDSECVMEDELCTTALASAPVPGPDRYWGDYGWQRSPFPLHYENGNGRTQSPGTDYAEQFWMARFYGFLDEPNTVLAWRVDNEACLIQ